MMRLLFVRLRGDDSYVQNLVGKSLYKRSLGRPRLVWEDDIRMNLREVECGIVDSWRPLVCKK
jgi:hypothetical protein